jgi:hypothetical protein
VRIIVFFLSASCITTSIPDTHTQQNCWGLFWDEKLSISHLESDMLDPLATHFACFLVQIGYCCYFVIVVIVRIVALSLTQPTLNLASCNLGEIRELATRG